jgi:hypothetical protein
LKSLVVVFWPHTNGIVNMPGPHGKMEMYSPGNKLWNHYSWGMCTTSTECKTVIIAVLMIMSGMDPHMISETWDGFWLSLGLGCVKVGLLGCWSVTVRLRDVIEVVVFEEMSSLFVYDID